MVPPKPPSSSRTVLIVLSIVGAAVLLCCGGAGFLGYRLFRTTADVDSAADRYAAETLEAIAQPWNADALWKRGDASFQSTVTQAENTKLVALYSAELGNMKTCGPFSPHHVRYQSTDGES